MVATQRDNDSGKDPALHSPDVSITLSGQSHTATTWPIPPTLAGRSLGKSGLLGHGGDLAYAFNAWREDSRFPAKTMLNVSGEGPVDSYIAARYRRLRGDSPVRHVRCTCLWKTLRYLAPRLLLFLKDSSVFTIYLIVPSIELPIHISPHKT